MLTYEELSCVVETLKQRHKYIKKSIENNTAGEQDLSAYRAKLHMLQGALDKLSSELDRMPVPQLSEQSSSSAIDNKDEQKPKLDKPMAQVKALVVDDEDPVRDLFCEMLRDIAVGQVEDAINGESCLSMMEEAEPPFDMVFCDWNMPGMAGIELLEKLRESEKFNKTIFIMVTAETDADKIKRAKVVGVDDYIMKPVDYQVLEDKMRRFVVDN